jgi:[ribosomal protein S5]-alanine N-acetyltransferase
MEAPLEIVFKGGKLREWRMSDIPSLVKYADNRKIWLNLRDVFPHPYTSEDAIWWIEHANNKPGTNFAIVLHDEAIGGIGLIPQQDVYRRSAELGYWLGEPFWGKGIMTAAVAAITAYTLDNFELVRLFATVFEWNRPSVRVLEKNGFQLEGKLVKSITKDNQLIDAFLYALTRDTQDTGLPAA